MKFASKANKDKLVSIQTDEFKVSWGLTVSEDGSVYSELNKVKGVENEALKPNEGKTTTDVQSLGKAVSGIIYEDAFGDYLDVRYSIAHQKVKEDLILNEKSDFRSYRVTYNVNNIKGAYAVLSENGEVTFYNGDDEALFKAGLPIMYDDAGESSADIQVNVVQGKKTIEITYTPSSEWLSDENRVYPVTIDPYVQSEQYTDNVWDTILYYIPNDTASMAVAPTLQVGDDSINYIKIHNLPTIPSSCNVLGATLNLYLTSFNPYFRQEGPAVRNLNFSKVTQFWNEYTFESTDPNFEYDPRYEIFGPNNHPDTSDTQMFSVDIISYSAVNNIYTLPIEIPSSYWTNSGGFTSYFATYYGFEILFDYRTYGWLCSSENPTVAYRPSIQVRYTVNQVPDIENGKLYRMKNVGSSNYLTVKDGGITSGANVYQSPLNTSNSHQVVRINYNTTIGAYYLRPFNKIYSNTSDIRFGTFNNDFANVYIGGGGYWAIGGNADGYFLHDIYSPDYVMSVYGNTVGNGTSLGEAADNIGSAKYSASNAYQKWIFELCPNQYNVNGANSTKYVNVDDISYIIPSFTTEGWINSDPDVVDVDSYGRVVAKQPGTAVLRDSNTNGQNSVITFEVLIPDGSYYIQNKEHENYVQLDHLGLWGTDKLELWNQDGEYDQLWELSYVGDGYYKIISYQSDNAITVREGKEGTENNYLVQQSYSESDRQKWRITKTDSGAYKIKAKSSEAYTDKDLVMCAGDGGGNGTNVEQREYNGTNNSYNDEWYLWKTEFDCWYSDADKIYYWKNEPTVYIEIDDNIYPSYSSSDLYDTEEEYIGLVQNAIDILNQKFDFNIQITDSYYSADIRIYFSEKADFVDRFGLLYSDLEDANDVIGVTYFNSKDFEHYKYYNGEQISVYSIRKALIGIFIHQDEIENGLLHVILHELTHSMGWSGHMEAGGNIMHPSISSSVAFSQEEIEHLKQIYEERNIYYEN